MLRNLSTAQRRVNKSRRATQAQRKVTRGFVSDARVESCQQHFVTLNGYDATHLNSVVLDNVIIDGITAAGIQASYTGVTLGPGNVNFTPSGTDVTVTNAVTGTSTPNACTGKWVTF